MAVATQAMATTTIALLIGVYIANGLYSSNYWAITQTLAGPYAAGKWTGK